jgi:hypothetical protein
LDEDIFQPRGLLIRVDLPGECADLPDMDVSSSKLYQDQHKHLKNESKWQHPITNAGEKIAGVGNRLSNPEKEAATRTKATRKGRIVIMPWTESDQEKVQAVGVEPFEV